MTCSQLLETLLGKAAVMKGKIGDGTAFGQLTEFLEDEYSETDPIKDQSAILAHKIGLVLKEYGMNRWGNERLYNGMTGELLEAQIFIGPCHYMRLKHMVVDKVHARSTGPRQILTRQPVEGRSRDGGLRWGGACTQCVR